MAAPVEKKWENETNRIVTMGLGKDFGPDNDDTDTSVYDNAFIKALDYAGNNGTIMLTPGVYRPTGTLKMRRGVSLVGVGRASEIVARFAVPDLPVIAMLPGFKDGKPLQADGVRLIDFHVRSEPKDDGAVKEMPSHGILMRRHHEFEVRGVSVAAPSKSYFTGAAFQLEGCYSGALYNCSAMRCRGGLEIDRTPGERDDLGKVHPGGAVGSNNITVTAFMSSGLSLFGGRIRGSHSIQLIGCELSTAEFNDETGVGDFGSGPYGLIIDKSVEGKPARSQAISIVGGLYAATTCPILVGDDPTYPVNGFSMTGAVATGLESQKPSEKPAYCVRLVHVNGAIIQGNVLQHYKNGPVQTGGACANVLVDHNFAIAKPPD